MKCKDMLPYRGPDAIAKSSELTRWDAYDLQGLLLIPEEARSRYAQVHVEAGDLAREGIRGSAGTSLLMRDVSISRVHLRYFGALLDVEVKHYAQGYGDEKRVKVFADLVDRQHRRLTTTYDLLLRLDATPAPRFQIRANQAAFMLDGSACPKGG